MIRVIGACRCIVFVNFLSWNVIKFYSWSYFMTFGRWPFSFLLSNWARLPRSKTRVWMRCFFIIDTSRTRGHANGEGLLGFVTHHVHDVAAVELVGQIDLVSGDKYEAARRGRVIDELLADGADKVETVELRRHVVDENVSCRVGHVELEEVGPGEQRGDRDVRHRDVWKQQNQVGFFAFFSLETQRWWSSLPVGEGLTRHNWAKSFSTSLQ